jgi:hypothetical protein
MRLFNTACGAVALATAAVLAGCGGSAHPATRSASALSSASASAHAGAFFFAPRLRAGHPENPSNKVLWIVRVPRSGHPLTITARPFADPSEVVRISRPADSSPGEIYPSDVDLPKPGCGRLSLAWGSLAPGAHRRPGL